MRFTNFTITKTDVRDGFDPLAVTVNQKRRGFSTNTYNCISIADNIIQVNFEVSNGCDDFEYDDGMCEAHPDGQDQLLIPLLEGCLVKAPTLTGLTGCKFNTFRSHLKELYKEDGLDGLRALCDYESTFTKVRSGDDKYIVGLIPVKIVEAWGNQLLDKDEVAAITNSYVYDFGDAKENRYSTIFCWSKITDSWAKTLAWHLHPVHYNFQTPADFFEGSGFGASLRQQIRLALSSEGVTPNDVDHYYQTIYKDVGEYDIYGGNWSQEQVSIHYRAFPLEIVKYFNEIGFKLDYFPIQGDAAIVVTVSDFIYDMLLHCLTSKDGLATLRRIHEGGRK